MCIDITINIVLVLGSDYYVIWKHELRLSKYGLISSAVEDGISRISQVDLNWIGLQRRIQQQSILFYQSESEMWKSLFNFSKTTTYHIKLQFVSFSFKYLQIVICFSALNGVWNDFITLRIDSNFRHFFLHSCSAFISTFLVHYWALCHLIQYAMCNFAQTNAYCMFDKVR